MMAETVMMFPTQAGISEMRAVIKMIKSGRNRTLSMADLADESGKEVDELLPIIEAAKILGFAKVTDGNVTLTDAGSKLSPTNFQALIKKDLSKSEPFKTTLKILREHGTVSTAALAVLLRHHGIMLKHREKDNEDSLRTILLRWGVRSRLLEYEIDRDAWRLK